MRLSGNGFIWFNGRIVAWAEAKVHVATHALHYATCVFEGIRAYPTPRGPAIFRLDDHVARLFDSCRIVDLPIPWKPAEMRAAIVETVQRNGYASSYIRPLVYRGYGELGVNPANCPVEGAVIVIEHGAHFGAEALERGIEVGVSSWRRMAPGTLPALAKSSANYLNSQLVMLEARAHGFLDGISLDHDGYAAESSGANLFVVHGGVLRTPPLASSILSGITRACVMRLARDVELEVREERLPREMLYTADEMFLTGTAAEITPVRSVDKRTVGTGDRGPITRRLQSEFRAIVTGESNDRHRWLTHIAS
jgi:branched-chain amino acid aminotransferase